MTTHTRDRLIVAASFGASIVATIITFITGNYAYLFTILFGIVTIGYSIVKKIYWAIIVGVFQIILPIVLVIILYQVEAWQHSH